VIDKKRRPEYVTCALTGMYAGDETWCGRKTCGLGFTFVDASHAALNAKQGGRLLLCPECSAAIVAALTSGTWRPK
jgi:hypothetical protein